MGELMVAFLGGGAVALILAWLVWPKREQEPVGVRLKDALASVVDAHRMLSNEPLVINFSHWRARDKFVQEIEADIGMNAGELMMVARAAGSAPMYDGVSFTAPRDLQVIYGRG